MSLSPVFPATPVYSNRVRGEQPQNESASPIAIGDVQTSKSNIVHFPSDPIPFERLPDNLSPKQAAVWLGYESSDSFLKRARATGLKIFEVNERVFRIDKQLLKEWRDRRTV